MKNAVVEETGPEELQSQATSLTYHSAIGLLPPFCTLLISCPIAAHMHDLGDSPIWHRPHAHHIALRVAPPTSFRLLSWVA